MDKIIIKNHSLKNKLLLNLSLPTLSDVQFYWTNDQNAYESIDLGDHVLFNNRTYKTPEYIFDLPIFPQQFKIIYLKVSSRIPIQLPLKLGLESEILNQIKYKDILFGIYVGIMMVMIFYNLFIYLFNYKR